MSDVPPPKNQQKKAFWKQTKVQHLYRHSNGRYYVRTFAGGKEKWTGLKTTLLSVAKNRMKEHLEAADKLKASGELANVSGSLTFGVALATYREAVERSAVRPNTKAFREAGMKLVLRSWPDVERLNVRRITSTIVIKWLRNFCASAKPHIPKGAKRAARNSTGASATTLKCAMDAVRQILDVAVESGHLPANPANNSSVTSEFSKILKRVRRQRAERGGPTPPSRDQFIKVVEAIRSAGVNECRAAADYIEFIAFCGARKNEAAHVKWEDVDFERGVIRLRFTKNGEAREVPMAEEMRSLLERMNNLRVSNESSDRVLLVGEAQGFIDSACRVTGVPRFTTHTLRHLFGTVCLEAGVDARTAAKWLGHKDNGALLLKVYSHVRRDHEEAMIKRVRFKAISSVGAASPSP
jgi:integrase